MERIRRLMSLLLILALCFTFIPTVNVEAASKVKINKTSTTVYIGEKETLKISGTSKKVKWNSSNKNVATVNSKGKVNPKKEGKATISAKVAGKTYKCKVTVKKPYINSYRKTLQAGKTFTLKLTGTKISAVKSSNKKVATINSKGIVMAKKDGKATISLTGADKKIYKCNVTVKHTHKWNKGEITLKSTCGETGIKTYTCSVCNAIKTEEISKTGNHVWDEGNITTEPTCGETGIKTYTCSVCNQTKTEEIPKTDNHIWSDWEIIDEATPEKNGIEKRICSVCNKDESREISYSEPHIHNYVAYITEPTCTSDGYTTYICKCGKNYISDYVDAIGHDIQERITKEPTCAETGIKEIYCIRCNEILGQAILGRTINEHNYEYKVIKEPTCTEDGIKIYACTICGEDSGQQWAIKAHHTWGEWEITKDAGTEAHTSVEQFGERVATCTVCGEKNVQTIINIDASAFDKDSDYSETTPNFICDGVIQVYGTFHRDMAYETLALVNELRTSLGLNELKWEDKFYDIGSIRAVEIGVTFAHRRPNGTKAAYVINSTGFSIKLGENILRDFSYIDAQEAYQAWHDSPGHYANMIDDSHTDYYSACFEDTEYGGFFWVQLFF